MAKLSTVDAVIERANSGDTAQMRTRVSQALDRATLRLELLLNTSFLRATGRKDQIAVNCNLKRLIDNGIFLFTKNAFVLASPAVVVKWGSTLTAAQDADAEVLPVSLVDRNKGLYYVELKDIPTERFIVELEYDYGFTLPASPGGDSPNDVYEGVPAGLKELAETMAIHQLMEGVACEDEPPKPAGPCPPGLEILMWPYLRNKGGAFHPIL